MGLCAHRKHNFTNLYESGLKRSEQRAVCDEGEVVQKIPNKHMYNTVNKGDPKWTAGADLQAHDKNILI